MAATKLCLDCKGFFSPHDFGKDASKKDGKSIYCRQCVRKTLRHRRAANPEKTKAYKRQHYNYGQQRGYLLRTRYGITVGDYDAILAEQNGGCAICDGTNKLVIDHNHRTGKVRGILCNNCNIALGAVQDNYLLLERAAIYLRNNGEL